MGLQALQDREVFGSGVWGLGVYSFVSEWIRFTLFGIILPTIILQVYTFWGL